jgi:toxin ParE1/3/4
MPFAVLLTDDAVRDLEDLADYIDRHDVPGKSDYVLDHIESVLNGLSENPRRGSCPRELLVLGIREYRELYFKPFRLIYRIAGDRVYVMLIADGRRDMQTLLQRRLLGS